MDNNKAFDVPSKVIMKMLMNYQILCHHCNKPQLMKEIVSHETLHCLNTLCSNELCGTSLDLIPLDNQVKFILTTANEDDEEKIACSKKCKKVAKFGHILKQNSENETLKAFEAMLKKKILKKQSTISLAQYSGTGNYDFMSGTMPQGRQNIHAATMNITKRGGRAISVKERGISASQRSAFENNDEELKQ